MQFLARYSWRFIQYERIDMHYNSGLLNMPNIRPVVSVHDSFTPYLYLPAPPRPTRPARSAYFPLAPSRQP